MKNVLFATTALVAFSGAAFAAGHGDTPPVTWGADIEVGYSQSGGGFYAEGGLDLTGKVELDYGVSVEVTFGADMQIDNMSNFLAWDDFPTITITTEWVTLTAGTVESAGADHYSGVDGMAGTTGFFEENGEYIVRADVSFGGIDASVSGEAPGGFSAALTNMSVGASGAFGSVSFGIGYDDGGDYGVSVGTSFGNFDIDLAYQADATDNSVGVAVGTTFGAMEVAAYYAMNSNDDDAYGVSVDGTFGAATVGVYWDADAGGASNFGATAEYAVSEDITVGAAYDQADSFEVYATMAIAEGAEVGAAYSDTGALDYDTGITVWFSAEF